MLSKYYDKILCDIPKQNVLFFSNILIVTQTYFS